MTKTVTRQTVDRREFCAGCMSRTTISDTEYVVVRTWLDGGHSRFHYHPGCIPTELLAEVPS